MELSYSGHFDLVLKVATDTWQIGDPGLSKFEEEFSLASRESRYRKDF